MLNDKWKIENIRGQSQILIIVTIMFIFSLLLVVYGYFWGWKKEVDSAPEIAKKVEQEEDSENATLSDYFDDVPEYSVSEEDVEFLKDDPFADMCGDTAGDGQASFKSNTVCLR